MKFLVLMFLAPMAWGQAKFLPANNATNQSWQNTGVGTVTSCSLPWAADTTRYSPPNLHTELPKQPFWLDAEQAAFFVKVYAEYKDSCWADSTLAYITVYSCEDSTCWCKKGQSLHRAEHYEHVHAPTFDEFVEFLKRRLK